MRFAPVDTHLACIAEERFARLAGLAQSNLCGCSPLQQTLAKQGIDAGLLAASLEMKRPGVADPFAAFCGSWVGGDIHDASRLYLHRWYPSQREGPWLVQRVLMLAAAGGAPTVAYNLFGEESSPMIRGLVDGRPYVGFSTPDDGLLWIGEETAGNISVHLEHTRAEGQLYEICGQVVRPGPAGSWEPVARSDWRYHRVDDEALAASLAALTPAEADRIGDPR